MSWTRRTFSASFKSEVILEALKEKETLVVLAKRFELLPSQISGWKAEAIKNMSAVFANTNSKKKEPTISIESFLKKSVDWKWFSKTVALRSTKEDFSMIDPKEKLRLNKQCEELSIPRSGLHYKPKGKTEENLAIMKIVDEQYFKTPFYGSRKLSVLLAQKGFEVNRKGVKRLWRRLTRRQSL